LLAILILFLIIFTGIAAAGDEQQINAQLQQGGLIHLQAQTYVITDSIILQSDTVLEGEPGTTIKLTDNAGWPTWQPLIKAQGVRNVTIRNIKIDANSDNQDNAPTWQGHTGHEVAKNWGMGNYNIIHCIDCDSVTINDCTFSNSLGDGLRVKTSSNIQFFNNTVYRMGHEGAYFIDSSGIEAYNNRMTSRTSNDLRLWNCQHVRFYKNVLDS
jgi:parallel beta-helix repeat protein